MLGICQKAAGWLIKQGFLHKNDVCTKCCSKSVSEVTGEHGQQVMKCTNFKCRHTMNLYKKNILVRNLRLHMSFDCVLPVMGGANKVVEIDETADCCTRFHHIQRWACCIQEQIGRNGVQT